MFKQSWRALLLQSIIFWSLSASAQTKPVDAEGHQWWQHAVFYEIYPRSFADSNDDGIGDLNGITSKLDYLQRSRRRCDLDYARASLRRRWISATTFRITRTSIRCTARSRISISLVAKARSDKVHIILDFVPNHTSDQHPWFLDSKSSRTSAHRDWYIWRDGKGRASRRTIGFRRLADRRGSLIRTTNQYYYHYFYAQQPDLNWRNPAVRRRCSIDALLVQARRRGIPARCGRYAV